MQLLLLFFVCSFVGSFVRSHACLLVRLNLPSTPQTHADDCKYFAVILVLYLLYVFAISVLSIFDVSARTDEWMDGYVLNDDDEIEKLNRSSVGWSSLSPHHRSNALLSVNNIHRWQNNFDIGPSENTSNRVFVLVQWSLSAAVAGDGGRVHLDCWIVLRSASMTVKR